MPRILLLALAVLLAASPALSAEYYVAPGGSDDADGSESTPFQTVARAQMAAAPGDTVFIRGGEYTFSGTSATVGVAFSKSGRENQRINYFAYPGEKPVFDLFELTPQERVTGFDVTASWIHLKGLEVRGVQQEIVGDSWGVRIRGNNNVIEQLDVHHGEAPGIFIAGSAANNLVLNCDSHHNYDPLEDGGNGDGFGCHSTGAGNVIRGCRGYWNSDDGFDFINSPGTCTAENSWAFNNGYVPETSTAAGNGAGFKAGGFGSPPTIPSTGVPRHVIRFNVAFGNRAQGFYANHHPGGLDFINNTAFDNGVNFDMLVEGGTSTHVLRNNVAMAPGTAISRFSGGTNEFNSWNLQLSVSGDDFESTAEADALMPRDGNGNLPNRFARPSSNSELIDAGTDVGAPFNGSAPDLGAYESGSTPDTGGTTSGGAGGAKGGAGAGGVPSNTGGTSGGRDAAGGTNRGGTSGASAGRGGSTGGSSVSSGAPGQSGGAVAAVGGQRQSGGGPARGGANAAGGTLSGASATGATSTVAPGAPNESGEHGCGCVLPGSRRSASALAWIALIAMTALSFARRRRGALRYAARPCRESDRKSGRTRAASRRRERRSPRATPAPGS